MTYRKRIARSLLKLSIAAVCCLLINSSADADLLPASKLKISQMPGRNTLHIQATQIPLSQLLAKLAVNTHTNLHYAALSVDSTITGDCLADLLSELMTCLLGKPVNSVVRYSAQGHAEEAWLLGAEWDGKKAKPQYVDVNTANLQADPENNILLEQAQSDDPATRASAITNLGVSGLEDKALASKLLTEALNDQNPDIRAKAIASLTNLQGNNAKPQLLSMLNDDNQDVRMAAVVAGYNNPDFLLQAQNDSDAQIRAMAEMSLARLDKTNNTSTP
ncbi:HEAT repeat domain-containing protein [Methylomonas sp. AM2-LC]|uniref:HEAT repeat domain-containing protein n=1 Tax=Methylomonas sp. AM2-LC TaxID=3153301 RepID=UPI003262DBA4